MWSDLCVENQFFLMIGVDPVITSVKISDWRQLQNEAGAILHECGFDAEIERVISTARGSVEVDIYARECIHNREYSIILECKNWKNSIPQNVIHAARLWSELTAFRAGHITLEQVDCAQGFYPLCSYCEHNSACPKFPQGVQMPQWEPTLEKLAALKDQRTFLDNEIKEMETVLKLVHRQAGTRDWVDTGNYRFRMSVAAGRTTLDKDALREELTEILNAEHMQPLCQQKINCKPFRPALPCVLAFRAFCRRKRKGDAVLVAGAHCTPIRCTVCRSAMLVFFKKNLSSKALTPLSISCWT